MITTSRSRWGLCCLVTTGLLLILALGGLQLLGSLLSPSGRLGPDGAQLLRSVQLVLLIDGLGLLVLSALLLDLAGLRRRVERRSGQTWTYTVSAMLYVVSGVSMLLLAKLVQDNTVHLAMVGKYFQQGTIFGRAVVLPVEPFSITDYSTSMLLLLAATVAFMGAVVSRHSLRQVRLLPASLWAMISAGLGYAGLDEYFTLHEFLGANTPWLKDTTLVHYPDDLVMGAYFALALLVFVFHLRRLARSRLGLGLLLLGAMLQGSALVADMKDLAWMAEETLEVLAAACYLLGMGQYFICEVAGRARGAEPSDALPGAGRGGALKN